MKIGNIKNRVTHVKLELEGEELNLKVRPWLMTPAIERELAIGTNVEQMDRLMAFFCEYVAEWDMVDEDGEPLSLDPFTVGASVPSSLIVWILRESQRASNPLGTAS